MPAADLDLISAAAEEAGRIALRYWRGQFRHWDKDAGAGPVTEADLAVNARLEELLRPARPDYGWLSEESPDDPARLTATRGFVIDPIDGTRAFIDGQEGFAVCIAVVEAGRAVAGVVHLPARAETYAAHAGGGARLNGQPVRPGRHATLADARVLTAKSTLAPENWRGGVVPPIRREFRPSLAWRFCLVAEGRFDAAMSVRPAWDWDIAAASLIAAEAGCVATDRNGAPFRFNGAVPQGAGLVVANPTLHAELIAALADPAAPPRLRAAP